MIKSILFKISRNNLRDILLDEEANRVLGDQVLFKSVAVLMNWLEEQDRKPIRIRISARTRSSDYFSTYY